MKIHALAVATKDRPKSFCFVVYALFSLAVSVLVFGMLSFFADNSAATKKAVPDERKTLANATVQTRLIGAGRR